MGFSFKDYGVEPMTGTNFDVSGTDLRANAEESFFENQKQQYLDKKQRGTLSFRDKKRLFDETSQFGNIVIKRQNILNKEIEGDYKINAGDMTDDQINKLFDGVNMVAHREELLEIANDSGYMVALEMKNEYKKQEQNYAKMSDLSMGQVIGLSVLSDLTDPYEWALSLAVGSATAGFGLWASKGIKGAKLTKSIVKAMGHRKSLRIAAAGFGAGAVEGMVSEGIRSEYDPTITATDIMWAGAFSGLLGGGISGGVAKAGTFIQNRKLLKQLDQLDHSQRQLTRQQQISLALGNDTGNLNTIRDGMVLKQVDALNNLSGKKYDISPTAKTLIDRLQTVKGKLAPDIDTTNIDKAIEKLEKLVPDSRVNVFDLDKNIQATFETNNISLVDNGITGDNASIFATEYRRALETGDYTTVDRMYEGDFGMNFTSKRYDYFMEGADKPITKEDIDSKFGVGAYDSIVKNTDKGELNTKLRFFSTLDSTFINEFLPDNQKIPTTIDEFNKLYDTFKNRIDEIVPQLNKAKVATTRENVKKMINNPDDFAKQIETQDDVNIVELKASMDSTFIQDAIDKEIDIKKKQGWTETDIKNKQKELVKDAFKRMGDDEWDELAHDLQYNTYEVGVLKDDVTEIKESFLKMVDNSENICKVG